MSNALSFTKIFMCATIATTAVANAKTETSKLPSVTVTAAAQKDGDVDGYKTGTTRSSTRTETSLLNVPQSISVVTQDQIKDQNISSMTEALRYVPGVVVHQGESNRDQISIRGNNTTADFFIDGARDDTQYFRDVYNIDRVEVLKGPNAMAFGRGGSGGLINRVSKIADGKRVRQIIATGGSFDNRRIQADLGDKVNDKVSLRLNTMYEKSGTFRQHGDLERYGFNPTASIKIAKTTDLKVGYEFFHDGRLNDRGIPSLNGAPLKTSSATFFGDATQDYSDSTVHSGFAILNHEFSSDLKVRNYTRYTQTSKAYQNVYTSDQNVPTSGSVNNSGNLNLSAYNNSSDRESFTNQTDLTAKFETGSLSHTTLIGTEIARQKSTSFRNTGFFNNATTKISVPVSNPISSTPITYRQSSSDSDNETQVNIYAGYVQDQVDISKYLQLTAGVRYDVFQMSLRDNRTNANFNRTDGLISPRAGLVFKPQEDVSIYTSYSVSYLPSSGDQFSTLTSQTQSLQPEKIENYEFGSKWDITPKLNVAAAIYNLNRTNTSANDPGNSGLLVSTGASRTRGLELSATGKITNKWQVVAAYALQDAVITKTTTAAASGKKVGLIPRNMASLWNKYDFTQEWAAAIGTIYQSDQYASVDNSITLKGFTRFDGAVYYNINPSYRLQVNAENLFGRRYIQTAHNNNNIQPGSPRAVKVSLIANF